MMKKGSVLMQVLMTAVVIAVIAAGLAKVILQRTVVAERYTRGAVPHKSAESALNTVMTAWNAANNTCVAVPGYNRSGVGPGGCNCKYTATDGSGTTICAGSQCSPAQALNPCTLQVTALQP